MHTPQALSLSIGLLGSGAVMAQPLWPPAYQTPVTRVIEIGTPNDLPWTLENTLMRAENATKARVNGKYRMLLLQFDDAKSEQKYGPFRDFGPSSLPPEISLPPELRELSLQGHWVYAAPSWYVWGQLAQQPMLKTDGDVKQVLGPPDTSFRHEISPTAWAKTSAAKNAWLLLEFERVMEPHRLQIHESLRPGSVRRITMMANDGSETEVWRGVAPTRGITNQAAIFELKLNAPPFLSFLRPAPPPRTFFSTNRVKLYFDDEVRGPDEIPHEIDAVALMDTSNIPQWASGAVSSDDFARQPKISSLIGGWRPTQAATALIDLSQFKLLH